VKELFRLYAYAGCLNTDTPQERLQKAVMVIVPTSISIACLFWSSGYYFFDKTISAAIPGGYAIISILSILLFFKTKQYNFFRFSQIFLILWLPFLLQASLGGFRAGSGVQIWAMLAPIGALMFHGQRPANYWLLAYIGLTVISGLLDDYLARTIAPLADSVIVIFFVSNLSVAFFLVYISVHYYVSENKRILRVINEQTQKLMQMDKIKNRFFANVSHEFRTPLALTIGPLEDALNNEYGDVSDKLRKPLQVMLRNSRRLLRLINQLLDISKLEAGEMKLQLQSCSMSEYFRAMSQSFVPYAERKQINFITDTTQSEIQLAIDKEKIEKIINNLLSNAFKFTPEGGRIKLSLQIITEDKMQSIRICVKDSGPGMDKAELDKIFDRFYQVDGSSTREHEGTGIGLSLVKELVDLHNGEIGVTSDLGFGSEFTVTLPIQGNTQHSKSEVNFLDDRTGQATSTDIEMASIDSQSENSISAAAKLAMVPAGQATILVVDDNTDIRDYVASCLAPFYNIVQAINGQKGLEQAVTHMPDLIISDIMMPVMDGYEFCRRIKADPELNHIPLMFLTAKASDEMVIEGLEKGADEYLAKPFNAKELLARTRNLIMLRTQEKQLKQLNANLEQKIQDQLEELIRSRRLSSYFSSRLLKRILSEGDTEELITERRNITILFCDLCNFTEMTDRLEVEQATQFLNKYLSEMTTLIEQQGATIIQIIGDAIMIFFGAPEEMESREQAIKAVQLSVAMQEKISSLSVDWQKSGTDFALLSRIGIHQDYVTVGNFGSNNLMEYTAVGRGVNLASRLEGSCTPGHIKVSHSVYLLSADMFPYEPLQEESFKGFSRQVKVCELNPAKVARDSSV